jgi:hypothetical protein
MKPYAVRRAVLAFVTVALAIALSSTGCSSLRSKKNSPGSTASSAAVSPKGKSVYYDFGDILLPSQLLVDSEESFVFTTAGLTAGVLSLKGRLTAQSLISFFSNKMPVDGWQMINKFTGNRNMMLFKKSMRYCTITIEEGQLTTLVEIWVAPTMSTQARGLHKF